MHIVRWFNRRASTKQSVSNKGVFCVHSPASFINKIRLANEMDIIFRHKIAPGLKAAHEIWKEDKGFHQIRKTIRRRRAAENCLIISALNRKCWLRRKKDKKGDAYSEVKIIIHQRLLCQFWSKLLYHTPTPFNIPHSSVAVDPRYFEINTPTTGPIRNHKNKILHTQPH